MWWSQAQNTFAGQGPDGSMWQHWAALSKRLFDAYPLSFTKLGPPQWPIYSTLYILHDFFLTYAFFVLSIVFLLWLSESKPLRQWDAKEVNPVHPLIHSLAEISMALSKAILQHVWTQTGFSVCPEDLPDVRGQVNGLLQCTQCTMCQNWVHPWSISLKLHHTNYISCPFNTTVCV